MRSRWSDVRLVSLWCYQFLLVSVDAIDPTK